MISRDLTLVRIKRERMMLVSTTELAAHLDDPDWVIFDCRHDLMEPAKGARVYAEGHVPGAHFAPVDQALSGNKSGRNGRHPLPAPQAFADFLAQHGVRPEATVVAYDDVGGQYAARLWWLARWIGFERVVLLDGGWPKWVAEKRAQSRETPIPAAGSLPVKLNPSLVWTVEDVTRRLGDSASALIDARAAERYRGEVEPMDPVAGHIPGALNRFFKLNLNADLTFRTPAELRQEFTALLQGKAPAQVGHQCGSGITACVNLFAMEHAGLRGSKLYAGSWSEWIADPQRPVSKG